MVKLWIRIKDGPPLLGTFMETAKMVIVSDPYNPDNPDSKAATIVFNSVKLHSYLKGMFDRARKNNEFVQVHIKPKNNESR